MIDTLAASKELKDSGLSAEQSDGIARVMAKAFGSDSIATKTDMVALEQRLTLKLGAWQVVVAGLLFAALRLT